VSRLDYARDISRLGKLKSLIKYFHVLALLINIASILEGIPLILAICGHGTRKFP
jgi:hypothetical protein